MSDIIEKKKKSKKRSATNNEEPATVVAAAAVTEEAIVNEEDAAAKAERKKRKKERKAAEAAAAAVVVAGDGEEEKPKKKKARTEPTESAATSSSSSSSSSSGDEDAEAKKKRKAEKKARKAAEAAAASGGGAEEKKMPAAASASVVAATGEYSNGPKHFRRAFYTQHPDVTAMTSSQVAEIRAELNVTIHPPFGSAKGANIAPQDDIRPLATFAQSNLPAAMLKCTETFQKPTAIQAQCWPAILQGRDVIGIAETGSGKTLGFMLPALIHILDQPKLGSGDRAGPIMLTLSPTRELAMQTAAVAEATGLPVGIRSTCIYGGADKHAQKKALKAGVHIVVATPGRLLGLIEEGALALQRVTYLVLDEADRMLDLGFEPDIRRIVGLIGPERQTLLFSATWPQAIQNLGREFVVNPFHVTIGKAGEQLAANHRVKQVIEVIDEWKRDQRLLELLKQYHSSRKNRVIIFVLYKKEVERVENWLSRNGWKSVGISGDKGQDTRTAALQSFKDGKTPLLIATDVAARGLDIPAVEHVINYSFPLTVEDYVHRIGRTGRGGAMGHSHTLFTAAAKGLAGELAGVLKEAGEEIPAALQAFGLTTKKKEHAMYGHHFKKDDNRPMGEKKHFKFE